MQKLIALAALGLVVAATAVAASPARTTDSELNIVQTAQQAGQFKTLLALATKAGLADDLATGELTVLAPTDAAFKKVPKATLRAVQRTRSC